MCVTNFSWGVSCTIGTGWCFFSRFSIFKSVAESVCERNHSDWLFSLRRICPQNEKCTWSTPGNQRLSIFYPHLIWLIHGYFHNNMAIWNELSGEQDQCETDCKRGLGLMYVSDWRLVNLQLYCMFCGYDKSSKYGEIFPLTQVKNVHDSWLKSLLCVQEPLSGSTQPLLIICLRCF